MEFLTTQQLYAAGFTQHSIRKALSSGSLYRIDHGVYSTKAPTPLAMIRYARSRYYCAFTGPSAMAMYDEEPLKLPIHIKVLHSQAKWDTPLLVTHRSRAFTPVTLYKQKYPVVFAPAAVQDYLSAGGDEFTAMRFLERQYAKKGGKTRFNQHLGEALPLTPQMKKVVNRASLSADSEAERTLYRALRNTDFEQNVLIGPYLWDFVHTLLPLAVEIGAFHWHRESLRPGARHAFVRDEWKANDATLRGYLVLRFTARCIDDHLAECVSTINQAIEYLETQKMPPPREAVWEWHRQWTEYAGL